jgi:hypothetical protein
MPEAVEPAWSAGVLLLIAAIGVLALLFLIMKVKLHAFLALVLVSIGVALAARIPLQDVVSTLTEGFGSTLASVALLVGLGAMLGRLLEFSGGAQVLADSLVRRFGEQRAPLALGVAALLFGFPIFFDAGLVVFLPIVFTVARRLGGSLLTYGLPVAGAFAVMHAFVPPHPGPVAAAELVGADIGLVLLFGLLIGLPTWFLGAYLFGTWAGRRYHVGVPDILSDGAGGGGAPAPVAAGGGSGGSSRRVSGGDGEHAGDTPDTVVEGTSPELTSSGDDRGARPADAPDVRHRPRPAASCRSGSSSSTRHEHPRHGGCRQRGVAGRAARAAHRRDARRAAHHGPRRVVRARHPPRTDNAEVESIVNSALGRSARSSSSPAPAACSAASCAPAASVRPWPTCSRTSACRSSWRRSSSPCCCASRRARPPWRSRRRRA